MEIFAFLSTTDSIKLRLIRTDNYVKWIKNVKTNYT